MNLMKYAKKTAALTLTAAIAMTSAMSVAADTYTDKTGSTYGYDYLGTIDNATGRQRLYDDIAADSLAVWNNTSKNYERYAGFSGEAYVLAVYDLNEYGLDLYESVEVFETVKNDNPLFYFYDYMDNYILSNSAQDVLILCVDKEYKDGATRANIQNNLKSFIDSTAAKAAGLSSYYAKARSVMKDVCDQMTYAYDEEGVPSLDPWAHNVVGPVTRNEGVCESYARTYQMLLNYIDLDALYVGGYANDFKDPSAGHAWNYVKMDDGEFYGFDLTWCDEFTDEWEEIVDLNYDFVVENGLSLTREEVEAVLADAYEKRDGYCYNYFAKSTDCFLDEHTPDDSDWAAIGTPSVFLYDLPTLGSVDYYVLGDANDDNVTNMADLVRLSKYLVNERTPIFSLLADTDGNERINMQDAVRLQKYLLGYTNETLSRTPSHPAE